MIHFNELYVTEDGKNLVVDAEIDNLDIYDNCFITNVLVDLGENCEGNGKSNHAITMFNDNISVVGDLDNDNRITDKDIDSWYILYDLCHGHELLQDETGWYYYDYDDERVNVSGSLVTIYNKIITDYQNIDSQNRDLAGNLGKLLAYAVDCLGNNILMGNTPKAPGDLNGDGEVKVSDINYFIDFLLRVKNGTESVLYKGGGLRHFRKCYSVNDLVPLVEPGTDLSSKLFIVTVHADCFGDVTAIAEADCGSDVNEITGVAYNWKPLYDSAVSAASSYGDTCDTKDAAAFEDFVLRYYGFLFALKCGDLCKAQYYWENYLNVGKTRCKRAYSKPCGCHGLY